MSFCDEHSACTAEKVMLEFKDGSEESTMHSGLGSFDESNFVVDDRKLASFDGFPAGHSSGDVDVNPVETYDIESIAMKSLQMMSISSEAPNEQGNTVSLVSDGSMTRVYYLCDPKTKCGGRTSAVAIKALTDDFPTSEQIDHLRNEYTVSTHLSQCHAARKALSLADFDGCKALFLEWESGLTLSDWIRAFHERENPPCSGDRAICESDLKTVLQIAWKISKALADIHDLNVAHNDLRPEHILVHTDRSDAETSVKIIGLGYASILTSSETVSSKKNDDITNLGAALFEMLLGQKAFVEKPDEVFKEELGTKRKPLLFLSRNELFSRLIGRVPPFLTRIVLDLIKVDQNSQQLPSARDLEKMLHTIILNFNTIMPESNCNVTIGRISFDMQKLYGRSLHLSTLLGVCNGVGAENNTKVFLVSGYSGAGKSALVEQVKAPLREKGTYFISGKFDHLQQVEPLSAIISAITECCNEIIRLGSASIQQAKTAIIDAVGTESGVLTQVFPSLCQIIGKPSEVQASADYMRAGHRFKFAFQMMIRAIATPLHPIILFMDDLQWVDELSLELITAVIMDAENKNFLFIGSYRSNELDHAHPLLKQLNILKSMNMEMKEIVVDCLSKEAVNEMISDVMKMPSNLTKSLAGIVYQKTSGNALFVTQFLKSLWDEDLLSYSFESSMWEWNSKAIEMKNISNDVGALLSGKILQLPSETQAALKLLACVGWKCDQSLLTIIMGRAPNLTPKENELAGINDNAEFERNSMILKPAVEEGLLKMDSSNYIFSHDQIKQAAYSLIPETVREHFHYQIGHLMCANLPDEALEEVLFVAVDQMNRGSINAKSHKQKAELASLNLRAGGKALSLSTFLSAASYFQMGISLLGDGHWEMQYALSLSLYSACAEAEYCNGHFQEVGIAVGAVIENAKSDEDKLSAYASLIKALGAQHKLQDAINLGLSILRQLGVEALSSLHDKEAIEESFLRTTKIFEEMTDDDVLNLKIMEDTVPLAAMKFLSLLCFYSFLGKQEYMRFFASQMMQMTFQYGLCKESSWAFAFYSFVLVGTVSNFRISQRSGNLALIYLEKTQAKDLLPRIYGTLYGSIKMWCESFEVNKDFLLNGYSVGMQTGDIEFAMGNIFHYLNGCFVFGQNLIQLQRELDTFSKQMVEYKQLTIRHLLLPIEGATKCLVDSINPLQLLDDSTDLSKSMENLMVACITYTSFSMVTYIFCEYEIAADFVQKRKDQEKKMERKYEGYGANGFYDGLIFLAMERKTKEDKWASYVVDALFYLKCYIEVGLAHTEHRILLLEAEMARNQGKIEVASSKYKLAVAAASKNEVIQEEAIANERAADFFHSHGDSQAFQYYSEAHTLYLQWGAKGKAEELCKNFPF